MSANDATPRRSSIWPQVILLMSVTFSMGMHLGRATAPEPKPVTITCTTYTDAAGKIVGAMKCERDRS